MRRYLIALLPVLFLVGCGTTDYQKTIASPYLGCTTEDITIAGSGGGWMTAHEGWIAVCRGKAVQCVESRDSGGGCVYLEQPAGQR